MTSASHPEAVNGTASTVVRVGVGNHRTASPPAVPVPDVSVIVPVRNDAANLRRCLRSLDGQRTTAVYEVVVADNGSHDESAAVAGRWADRLVDAAGVRVGEVRNRAVSRSTGAVLAFVDSDHAVPPDWLEAGLDALRRLPAGSAVGYPYLAPPDGTWVQRTWQTHRCRHAPDGPAKWLGAGDLFVRRADFDRVGGFDGRLRATEDVDFCARLMAGGGGVFHDRRVANVHHGEPATLTAFFRKEWWRAGSNLTGFLRRGLPRSEWTSLALPVHFAAAAVAFLAGSAWLTVALLTAVPAAPPTLLTALAFAALVALPLALALATGRRTGRWGSVPALTVLYLVYGCGRAMALFVPGERVSDLPPAAGSPAAAPVSGAGSHRRDP